VLLCCAMLCNTSHVKLSPMLLSDPTVPGVYCVLDKYVVFFFLAQACNHLNKPLLWLRRGDVQDGNATAVSAPTKATCSIAGPGITKHSCEPIQDGGLLLDTCALAEA
jgi:hypothetical protein